MDVNSLVDGEKLAYGIFTGRWCLRTAY